MRLYGEIKKHGAGVVIDHPLSAKEIGEINLITEMVFAFQDREPNNDWAAWALDNQTAADLLGMGLKQALEMGFEVS